MATTPNRKLTLLEVGQKEKEVTINTNFSALDNAPNYLGVYTGGTQPSITSTVPLGSYYYDQDFSSMRFLIDRNEPQWV